MNTFTWRPLTPVDPERVRQTRYQLHQAIQNVAAVGRKFSPESPGDEYAALTWVPGLSRMAGHWVSGDKTFRSSISPESFAVYLVDEKVIELASFELEGQTHRQVMLWLEEQIGRLGLHAPNLAMNTPYEIPTYPTQQGEPFSLAHPEAAAELSKLYHNSYVTLRMVREQLANKNPIRIWPHHFDQDLIKMIKDTGDPETNTYIGLGMSPGDKRFDSPYFYVNSWPYVDTQLCKKLSNNGIWVSDDWTGAVLLSKHLWEGNQEAILHQFYDEAYTQLFELLTK